MSIPTKGEQFAMLLEHLAKGQEAAAMIGHLTRDEDKLHAQGWIAVSEMLKKVKIQVTQLATRGMH